MFKRFLNWFRSLWDDDFARVILINSVLDRVARNNPKQRSRLLALVQIIRIQNAMGVEVFSPTKSQVIQKIMEKVDPLDQALVLALLTKVLKGWRGDLTRITALDLELLNKVLDQIDEVLQIEYKEGFKYQLVEYLQTRNGRGRF